MPSSNIKRKKKPVPNSAPSSSPGSFTETAMDEFLARKDLFRKPIAKDGSCLFRAVSEQVYNCQARHLQVRKDCIDFMRRNKDKFEAFLEGPFDHHLFRLQNPKEWAGQVEISALSLMYKKDFVVYQDVNAEPTKVTDNDFKDKILLCYSNGNHYDAVYSVQFQKDAAMCQSLMYEILYQRVFSELDRRENSFKQNLTPDTNNVSTTFYQNGFGEDDGAFKDDGEDNTGWTEVKSRSSKAKSARQNRTYEEESKEESVKPNLDQKHGWQAKRSLDSELYRNVELEVWEDSKNGQEREDRFYAASIQYQPGDKCFAWLGQQDVADKVYEAIVVFSLPIQKSIEVRIPELQNKSFVIPLENLKPTANQQEMNYKELSGYYKKSEATGGPSNNEGLRDEGKRGRRRNMSARPPPRGGSNFKGDEQSDDTSSRKGFQDDSFPRQRPGAGSREKFSRGRGRGRYQRGRDERGLVQKEADEEAKLQEAEQAKLAELQDKDPAAFPALPTQQAEEKPPSTEAGPDQTPAEFWSRLKNAQGKPLPSMPKELDQLGTTESKPASTPASPTNQQPDSAKLEDEKNEERPQASEPRSLAASHNGEVPNKLEEEAEKGKKLEIKSVEPNSHQAALQSSKPERRESPKQEKELKNEIDQQRTDLTTVDVKSTPPKPVVKEGAHVDAEPESKTAWSIESVKMEEPNATAKETEEDIKKTEEVSTMKPNVRGVIRMANLTSTKPAQQATETETPPHCQEDDIKQVKKEETSSLKSALAGESSASSSPEKKTVKFADDPPSEAGEIKVLLNTGKDLSYKDGKREILAPPTLVSVVMKPPPGSDYSQQDSSPVSILTNDKPNKNSSEDEVTTSIRSSFSREKNTKPVVPSPPASDTNQSAEGADSASSVYPTISQHQSVTYQLPPLPVMYTPLPNMTSHPRMPQGISIESDGSDLPEDPNTLRYFYNLGFQYHVHMSQQWANQQMMFYPSIYPVPSQDHMPPHPAVSVGQQLTPAVPQMMYQPQQMQAYHPSQVQQVVTENTSFSERNSLERTSPGQASQQQQQQHQQQPGIPLHQGPSFIPNQHHTNWRPRSMTGYQGKQSHVNAQFQNQQTPRGPMQHGGGNSKYKKKFKHRNDQFPYGAQSHNAQNQGTMMHNTHGYSNPSQTAGSSNPFYLPGGDHGAGKGSGDYFHSSQQYGNFHSNASSGMTQAPHTAPNTRAQYP